MESSVTIIKSGTRGTGMERLLRDIRVAQGVKGYKVGWPEDATYPDGKSVAEVAIGNEFGIPEKHIPARPFFRMGNANFKKEGAKFLLKRLKGNKSGTVTARINSQLAQFHVNTVQKSIHDLKEPPNSPTTIEMKGSDDPLIDTGLMVRSLNYETT